MKPIIVRDQVRLGPRRCLMLTVSGMYYRMSRSAITVLILSLAVAFLSYMLYYGIISHDTEYAVGRELRSTRLLGEWISRLSAPDHQDVIFANLVAGERDRIDEYRTWGALSDTEVRAITAAAGHLREFTAYFAAIPQSSRAMLVADKDPTLVARELADPARFDLFAQQLAGLKLQPPFKDAARCRQLITVDLPRAGALVGRIHDGQEKTIQHIQTAIDSNSWYETLVDPSPRLKDALARGGYRISPRDLQSLSQLARQFLDKKELLQVMERSELRGVVARKANITKISELTVDTVLQWTTSPKRAQWLSATLAQYAGQEWFPPERLEALARAKNRNSLLERVAGPEAPEPRRTLFALPGRTRWLILVSFLVCIVGITNTMLMSVTDRFSEIATMKCIGAMDGFIMMLFVFEAFFLAIVGSVIGVVLGLILALLRSGITYGGLAFESIPLADLCTVSLVSFLTGILIAALAATSPAWAAARLAPMEAMRVE